MLMPCRCTRVLISLWTRSPLKREWGGSWGQWAHNAIQAVSSSLSFSLALHLNPVPRLISPISQKSTQRFATTTQYFISFGWALICTITDHSITYNMRELFGALPEILLLRNLLLHFRWHASGEPMCDTWRLPYSVGAEQSPRECLQIKKSDDASQ